MKTILLFICAGFIILTLSHTRAEPGNIAETSIVSSGFDTLHFKTAVQPVLQKNCSPCHFTGGKMYEKMPFDNGETILRHEDGILKRFNDNKEVHALVMQFIKTNKRQ